MIFLPGNRGDSGASRKKRETVAPGGEARWDWGWLDWSTRISFPGKRMYLSQSRNIIVDPYYAAPSYRDCTAIVCEAVSATFHQVESASRLVTQQYPPPPPPHPSSTQSHPPTYILILRKSGSGCILVGARISFLGALFLFLGETCHQKFASSAGGTVIHKWYRILFHYSIFVVVM